MNLSTLFSGGGGRFATNPKHLPLATSPLTDISLKTRTAGTSLSNVAGFFTNIAFLGAQTSIATADTYVTVCDLTGAGLLFNAVTPTHSADFIPTIRITVDGVVYVIAASGNITALNRVVLGAVTPGASTLSGESIVPNVFNDSGFTAARLGGIAPYSLIGIPSESMILSYGMPALRYETSLKVEMKCNLLSATAVHKQCAVTYRMDL